MRHVLRTSTHVPRPREEVFAFFSAAENLQRTTPPESIVTPLPVAMREGARIDYRLRLFGVGFRWRTEITRWNPPHLFVDEQRSGPYRDWVHTHRLVAERGGTRIEDEVVYRLPLWPVGEAAYPLLRLQLARIFRYRRRRIRELLG